MSQQKEIRERGSVIPTHSLRRLIHVDHVKLNHRILHSKAGELRLDGCARTRPTCPEKEYSRTSGMGLRKRGRDVKGVSVSLTDDVIGMKKQFGED